MCQSCRRSSLMAGMCPGLSSQHSGMLMRRPVIQDCWKVSVWNEGAPAPPPRAPLCRSQPRSQSCSPLVRTCQQHTRLVKQDRNLAHQQCVPSIQHCEAQPYSSKLQAASIVKLQLSSKTCNCPDSNTVSTQRKDSAMPGLCYFDRDRAL